VSARTFVLAALLSLTLACSPPAREHPQALLAALGTAQALQHEADEREARGEITEAIATVERVLEVPFPAAAPEREDVRLDAWGRIAELDLARADDVQAEEAARTGLAEATRDSYFRARLHVVMGRIHQARAERLRAAGDADGARAESESALSELESSIDINAAVLGIDRGGADR
jgi:hypothetical protein